jgi:hypothetical protein
MAPRFEVDPMWPKPLPNHWVLGNVIGVAADANDHIWIVHRGAALERMETYAAQTPPASECCAPAPPVGVRRGGQPGRALGRTRQGLQLAQFQSRNYGRLQRQRVDWRERPYDRS